MKFELQLVYIPNKQKEERRVTVTIDGDLDTVKTYIKLSLGDHFNWGRVSRIDKLGSGDVSHWLVQQHRASKELRLMPFSFYDVDPIININAMQAAVAFSSFKGNAFSDLLVGEVF